MKKKLPFNEAAASGFGSDGLKPRQRPKVGLWSVWRFWLWRARGWRECGFSSWRCFSRVRLGLCPSARYWGLLAAVVIGALIYQGGMRLNLAKVFPLTGAVLIVVAAGLVAGSPCALHEAGGVKPPAKEVVFDSSKYLHEDPPRACSAASSAIPTTRRRARCWRGCCIWFRSLIWFLHGSRPAAVQRSSESIKGTADSP